MAAVCAGAAVLCVSGACAQQLIGYVKADDANVTGATDVMDGQAVLSGSVGVTAKDHTAVITLGRGGLARVCQTSALHMTQSKVADAGTSAPLLFSLEFHWPVDSPFARRPADVPQARARDPPDLL